MIKYEFNKLENEYIKNKYVSQRRFFSEEAPDSRRSKVAIKQYFISEKPSETNDCWSFSSRGYAAFNSI